MTRLVPINEDNDDNDDTNTTWQWEEKVIIVLLLRWRRCHRLIHRTYIDKQHTTTKSCHARNEV
jgi:hypothetical protein